MSSHHASLPTAGQKRLRPVKGRSLQQLKSQSQLYLLLLPALVVLIMFSYLPMYGITIAFKNLRIGESIFQGQWVGLKQFERLFRSNIFGVILKNTLTITFIQHFILWPIPILFALLVHNSPSRRIGKFSQTASYLPHLVSTVVVVSIIELFAHQNTGLINIMLNKLGYGTIRFLSDEQWFLPVYFTSGIWSSMGASAVIYIAALSAVDPQLIEAATIDGATKLKRIWHIDLPTIRPTIIILLILGMGQMLKVGFEKPLLMQNDLNLGVSEIIDTYVYKRGLLGQQYSFAAAVSLFNNVIGLLLVIISNQVARKMADISLF